MVGHSKKVVDNPHKPWKVTGPPSLKGLRGWSISLSRLMGVSWPHTSFFKWFSHPQNFLESCWSPSKLMGWLVISQEFWEWSSHFQKYLEWLATLFEWMAIPFLQFYFCHKTLQKNTENHRVSTVPVTVDTRPDGSVFFWPRGHMRRRNNWPCV